MKLYLSFKNIAVATVGILVFAWSIIPVAESASNAPDWHQWRGPNRDGISTEKGWLSIWPEGGPKVLWKTSVGTGYSTVSVSNGRVYTMGNAEKTDTVYCLDANTGDVVWTHSYPCVAEGGGHPGTASTPTVDGKVVYTLSRDGDLFCLDANLGKVIWSKVLQKDFKVKVPGWSFACSPLVLDNWLILDVGPTLALDKATGNLVWKSKEYAPSYSSPFLFKFNGLRRLAVFPATGLVVLDAENGKELGILPWKGGPDVNAVTPIVAGDKIFISSGYDTGCALVQFSGNKLTTIWQNKTMRNHFNSCVLWEGHLYGFDETTLKCLDFQTGDEKWAQRGLGKGSLMLADGKLIVMGDKGDLVIAEVSPERFKEISRAKVLSGLCWTVPVLSGGKLYCRNHEGTLVCLDVSGK
ncbi:alcohol dehydrogenase [Candidatus Poribacteria bacterium]|nr:alcohol dehydrogenase [Candidatus Poribacteria bacterium]